MLCVSVVVVRSHVVVLPKYLFVRTCFRNSENAVLAFQVTVVHTTTMSNAIVHNYMKIVEVNHL